MQSYYLLCGPEYFCLPPNRTHEWNIWPNSSHKHLNVCPECQCDVECIKRGDCCADLYFSFPDLNCVNRTLINGRYEKNKTEQSSALMVTSCPSESDQDLKKKCVSLNDTKSRMRNFPVTRLDVPLTFYNKYCAECHGVFNYTSWTLDIDCSKFADFNFLSTLDEVIDMAYDRKCIFQAFREDDSTGERKQQNCFDIDEKDSLYTKCNQTGEWPTYDINIAYACESYYKGKYRVFKNVFCYMCNPSGHEYEKYTLTTCNDTGQWATYDSGLQRACSYLPTTPSTLPYKNIFCYLCNRGNDSSQMFVDVFGQFKEYPLKGRDLPFEYDMHIADYNFNYFIHTSLQKMEKDNTLKEIIETPFDAEAFKTIDGSVINMTNLLLKRAAMDESKVRVCKSRYSLFPKGYSSSCLCEISCPLRYSKYRCCEDLLIQVPMHCYDTLPNYPKRLRLNKGLSTINGCLQERSLRLLKVGCSFPEAGDIFSEIPITKSNDVHYDNFYCVLCNLNSDKFMKKMQGKTQKFSFTDLYRKLGGRLPDFGILQSFQDPSEIDKYVIKKYSNLMEENDKQIYNKIDNSINVDHYLSSKDKFSIWGKIHMFCPRYVDFSHHLRAGDIIRIAKQMKCRIKIEKETKETLGCYLYSPPGKSRCADRLNWTYSDHDMEWACNSLINVEPYAGLTFTGSLPQNADTSKTKQYRQSTIYKNIFCAFCAPEQKFPEHFIDNCTKPDSSASCLFYPRIYYYYPYKNIHCARCNGISTTSGSPGGGDYPGISFHKRVVGKNWFPILRNLFSISGDDITENDTIQSQCKMNQVFDQYQGVCRNITCYSGKYLNGGECIPLLQRTMNLQYSMTIRTRMHKDKERRDSFSDDTFLFHQEGIKEDINKHLKELLGFRPYVRIESTKDDVNESLKKCSNCMQVTLKIFLNSSVSRLHIERSLIESKLLLENSSKSNTLFLNNTFKNELRGMTMLRKRSTVEQNSQRYFGAKVSKVLLCPQIELEAYEYNISNDDSALVLTRGGFGGVAFDEFALTPDGNMRVCLEYLQKIQYLPIQSVDLTTPVDHQQRYLWIMSLAASVASVLSLILGLAVYLILPSLRTIPGKLIMILMASLLFTLTFLQLSYFAVNAYYGCITVAIVLHFSWLAAFMCTQTANFHMWRTFTSKEVGQPSARFLMKYLMYILGMPSSLVCINIAFGWAKYSDPFYGYGGGKCFIKDKYLLIGLFIIPVALICVLNLLFFSLTALAYQKDPDS
ncbi:hypothetical protein FSP39_020793 [Pinctada imbricata]|uniref:G-protein coupled receptors family 2 profile 2 domain-containing protein n=1 Tax=Pinctada imbricata TaxID=66713 RepID=A0AA88XDJ7_PINIB|nr:hypothetical protein FSP39_020793 [Pinctada imbricata]